MSREHSCGAVVFTRRGGQFLYLIVRGMSGFCGFPKGHVEPGETEEETARREILEETGLEPVFLEGFRETEIYDLKKKPGTDKEVVYFLAEFGDAVPFPRPGEILEILLLPFGEAQKRLTRAGTRRVLAAADGYLRARGPAPV